MFIGILQAHDFFKVNDEILREVFQGSHPEVGTPSPHGHTPDVIKVADTHANYNQACRLFIDGRCNMGRRCRHIHLIPPPQTSAANQSTSNSLETSSECDFRVNIPRAVPYEKSSIQPVMSDTLLLWTDFSCPSQATYLDTPEPSTSQNIRSVPSGPPVDTEKVAVEIASSDRVLTESDQWGHATDLNAWLASDSIRDEIKISSVAWSNGTDLELQGWGFETDVRAWLTDSESSDTSVSCILPCSSEEFSLTWSSCRPTRLTLVIPSLSSRVRVMQLNTPLRVTLRYVGDGSGGNASEDTIAHMFIMI